MADWKEQLSIDLQNTGKSNFGKDTPAAMDAIAGDIAKAIESSGGSGGGSSDGWKAKLSKEVSERKSEDARIEGRIDSELSGIGSQIESLMRGVNQEASRAQAAEAENAAAIATEKSERETAVQAVASDIAAHVGDKSNPHSVTAEQVGAYTKEQVDGFIRNWSGYVVVPFGQTKPEASEAQLGKIYLVQVSNDPSVKDQYEEWISDGSAWSLIGTMSIDLSPYDKIVDAKEREAAITAAISTHVGDDVKHVTAAERNKWNGKQDAIGDLENIRNNASTGATHAGTAHAPADAQRNVQSDWNATSGDAFIKNKPNINGNGNDFVHKRGDETVTGNKTFSNEYNRDLTKYGNGYTKVKFSNVGRGEVYSSWDESIKDGLHFREWFFKLPANIDFWGMVIVTIGSTYSSSNGSGFFSKEIQVSFNKETVFQNEGRYVKNGNYVSLEFRISDFIFDEASSSWGVKIRSMIPSSNNDLSYVSFEFYNAISKYNASLIEINTAGCYITTGDRYKRVFFGDALTSNSFEMVEWSKIPCLYTDFAYVSKDYDSTATNEGSINKALEMKAPLSHVGDNTHVTETERQSWNGKQDAIGDLDTIRSNAANALKHDDNISELNNDAGYLTDLTMPQEVFWVDENTTYQKVTDAVNSGQFPILKKTVQQGNNTYKLFVPYDFNKSGGTLHTFSTLGNFGGLDSLYPEPVQCLYELSSSDGNFSIVPLAKSDGSNASGTWPISVSGKSNWLQSKFLYSSSTEVCGIWLGTLLSPSAGAFSTATLLLEICDASNFHSMQYMLHLERRASNQFSMSFTELSTRSCDSNVFDFVPALRYYNARNNDSSTTGVSYWWVSFDTKSSIYVNKQYVRASVARLFYDNVNFVEDYRFIREAPSHGHSDYWPARMLVCSNLKKEKGTSSNPVYVDDFGFIKPCNFKVSIGGTPGSDSSTIYFV